MCKIIAIANQKGGVAKTTTTINLGVGLSKVGKRVMLIDADPQGHLTMGLGFPKNLKNPYKVGKQSYKELKSQGSGLSNIEITDGNIKSFERVAKKYRLDFALKKDSSTKPPTYYVFFKGQDTEMMNLAFKKYLGVQMNKKDKPSIMKKLIHFKDAVSKGKNRERAREQQKDRGQSL
ncbi:DUF3801 domain-containing protein [Blautia intestinalis]|uniref:DUF3801 domain-containing protein n=1 Tax=Blautia intestinalis TaxID=2763028 RepID=UPI0022E77AF2|nr:DUF3801 domain-containing protein [Blautia intestinalis]